MKELPNERDILGRMAPGVLSREGFLGDDLRPLQEILDTDRAAVERLGLTHERIARALDEACDAARAAMGCEAPIAGGRLRAVFHEAMGCIPSPFGDGVRLPKGEVVVAEPRTGRTLRFSPLSVYLIRRYGFYQGRGSRYRLEPADVASIFALEAEGE